MRGNCSPYPGPYSATDGYRRSYNHTWIIGTSGCSECSQAHAKAYTQPDRCAD